MSNKQKLERLDEFLGLPLGTTCRTIFGCEDRSLIGERLALHGIVLDKRGNVPKEQWPRWQELMDRLGIGQEWYLDPAYLDPPPQDLPILEL
jgi:hypothetical protein